MTERGQRALIALPDDAAPLPAGIHRLALPTPFPIGRVNCYLLEGDPLTLVDTGVNTGISLDILEMALAALGYRLEDLELLVLTHQHLDHLGLATVIARRAQCQVAAFAPLQLLFDPDSSPGEVLHAHLTWATAQLERSGYSREIALGARTALQLAQALGSWPQIDLALREGDLLRAGGRDWEVLHRPGHSLADLLFVDRATGVAISGDHLLASTSPNPTLSAPLEILRPDETTERARSLPLYLSSLRRTDADGLQLLLPGHGPTIGPPSPLIAQRLAFHARRADKLLHMLGQSPRTVYELAVELWKTVPAVQPHLTNSEVIGHLDVLERDGLIAEAVIGEGVVGYVRADG